MQLFLLSNDLRTIMYINNSGIIRDYAKYFRKHLDNRGLWR